MHVSRSESSYSVFYEIDNTLLSKWYLLDLHFSVLASSNAHILITETENGIDNMPVYEIVLGAGSNKYSDIRRKIRNEAKATASTVGILSSIDYRSFWIRIWTGKKAVLFFAYILSSCCKICGLPMFRKSREGFLGQIMLIMFPS